MNRTLADVEPLSKGAHAEALGARALGLIRTP
jgi:hypothetical protein